MTHVDMGARGRGRPPQRRRSERGHGAGWRGEAGSTLLEVVLALLLLSSMMAATTGLVVNALGVGQNSRLRQVATDIASSTLDCAVASLNVASANFPTPCGEPTTLINAFGYSGLAGVPALYPNSSPPGTVTRGGRTYTVEQEVQAGSGSCGIPAGGAPPELQVTDWVTWATGVTPSSMWWQASSMQGRYVEESTIVAVPAIALNPNDGSIKVAVTDDASNGQKDLSVVATNTQTGVQTRALTTDLGCALFLNMPPGPYTVSVTPQSGTYIDSNNDVSGGSPAPLAGPNMDGTVQASATLTLPDAKPYYYAAATEVNATYSVPQPQGLTWSQPYVTSPGDLATSLPLSFWDQEPNGLTTDPYVAPPPPASGDPVFPFQLSPYYVVAGSCGIDSSPDGFTGGEPSDGVQVPSSGSLPEGGTVTANFTLTPIGVVVTDSSGQLSGATVEALPTASTPTGGPDSNCSTTSPTAMPVLQLGATAAAQVPAPGGATVTTLASSANPSISGTAVTFTASVAPAPPAIGTPTGDVTFSVNGVNVATVPVSSAGVATYSPSPNLATGNYTVTATYAGGGGFTGSSAPSLSQVVNPNGQRYSTTTSTPVSSADPSQSGDAVTFTATVSSAQGTPTTGTVQFYKNGTAIGAAVPVDNGLATSAPVTLTTGTYSITASYTPGTDNNFAASGPSAALSQVAGNSQDTTTSAVTSSANPGASGQSITFTATISSAAGTPSGTVQFKDNGASLGSPVSVVNGVATSAPVTLAPGNHSITAVFTSSDPNYAGSTSPTYNQLVAQDETLSSLPDGYYILYAQSSSGSEKSTNTTTAVLVRVEASGLSESVCTGGSYPSGSSYYSGGSCSAWSPLSSGALVSVPVQ